jgi:hypothetical protein
VGHKVVQLGQDIRAVKRKKKKEGNKRKNGEVGGWAGWGTWPKRVLENSKHFSISYFDSNSNLI